MSYNYKVEVKSNKINNCIPNFNKFETTIDIGIIILGKYTFPKICSFFLKVSDVAVKHSLK